MKADSRKKNGLLIKVNPKESEPKLAKSLYGFTILEGLVVKSLSERKVIIINEDQNENNNPDTAA